MLAIMRYSRSYGLAIHDCGQCCPELLNPEMALSVRGHANRMIAYALIRHSVAHEKSRNIVQARTGATLKAQPNESKCMSIAADQKPTFLTKLKSRDLVAEGTMAFHFEKPASFENGEQEDCGNNIVLLRPTESLTIHRE